MSDLASRLRDKADFDRVCSHYGLSAEARKVAWASCYHWNARKGSKQLSKRAMKIYAAIAASLQERK